MNRSNVCYLIQKTIGYDSIGQSVPTETKKMVFCNVCSVSGSEWFEAGRNGIKSLYKVTTYSYDYNGETEVELDGVRYGVYRTYEAYNDCIELYLQEKGGVNK